MVGIDVVDMTWGSNRRGTPAYQHRDYLTRISSANEREWVMGTVRPDIALWQLWAAKEATYKALSPADGAPAFRPAEIAVRWRLYPPGHFGEAQWGAARTHVVARTEGPCTYAVAVRVGRPPIAIEHGIFPAHEILALPENTDVGPAEQSEAGRRAGAYLLRLIGFENAAIARADSGRPYVKSQPHISVSWSHDGEWVAAIAAVEGGIQ
jgi:phosphopantetheinyl transferase (holo-ACP synthase)